MGVKIQLRNDTSTNWTNVNPILAQGEVGVESNTRLMKIGNGSLRWNELEYYTYGGVGQPLPSGGYGGTAQDLNTAINNIGNSSPKGVYATLTALQTAFPTGTTGIYVVTADGNWYYWSGSAWVSGGVYQATSIADDSITRQKLSIGGRFCQGYSNGILDFNFTTNKITFPTTFGIIFEGTAYNMPNQAQINIDTVQARCLVYNRISGLIYLTTGVFTTKDEILIATIYGFYKFVSSQFRFSINGITSILDNSITNSKIADNSITNSKIETGYYIPNDFEETNQRIIFSPHLFLLKNKTLPIYKSSIISNSEYKKQNNLRTYVFSEKIDQTPIIKSFDDELELSESNTSNSMKITMRSEVVNAWYSCDVTRYITDPSLKTQQPKILSIGDSLTNRNVIQYAKDKLLEVGITSTHEGTITNLPSIKGEGRESWSFANFIGRDNQYGTVGTNQILPLLSGSVSTLRQNPFIKIATTQEKTDYPNWCFRNTGSFNELSYAEDTDKTGDFYIFDFEHYITNHSINVPDIITIALGTNDINKSFVSYNITGINSCRLGLEIMLKRIKQYLPNVKIGVIPSPAWGEADRWRDHVSKWIDFSILDTQNYNLTDVYVLPVWAHMNRTFIFPYGSTDISNSYENKNTNTDTIHFNIYGQKQYSEVTTAFIVNMLN